MTRKVAWEGFIAGKWEEAIDVRDFIQKNYVPYEGDEGFLKGATQRTRHLMDKLIQLQQLERAFGGRLSAIGISGKCYFYMFFNQYQSSSFKIY